MDEIKYPIEGRDRGLPLVSIAQATADAKIILEEERDGKQRGLYCRFKPINVGMLRYWRFGYINLIGGSSGAGKSYMLNHLHEDFTNPLLNGNCIFGLPVILHFAYESRGSDEVIRNIGAKLGKSYSYLLSAEFQAANRDYNRLTDDELAHAMDRMVELKDRTIYYTKGTGNRKQMYDTIYKVKSLHPNRPLIITTDHSHLIKKAEERNDLELIAEHAQDLIKYVRDFDNPMIIDLAQLNADIEDIKRRENPTLHYPIKGDVHGSNQLFWACDNVILLHRPDLIGIKKYGIEGRDSKDLIHAALIKTRFGRTGNIWLQSELNKGRIIEYTPPIQKFGVQ